MVIMYHKASPLITGNYMQERGKKEGRAKNFAQPFVIRKDS